LSGQDVGDEVIPVQEPLMMEDVENIKHRGGVGFLNPRRGRAVGTRVRRGRRGQLQLLFRKREDRGGYLASSRGRGSHHQKEVVVVRDQEGMAGTSCQLPSKNATNKNKHIHFFMNGPLRELLSHGRIVVVVIISRQSTRPLRCRKGDRDAHKPPCRGSCIHHVLSCTAARPIIDQSSR
jgi:hypothetical protein